MLRPAQCWGVRLQRARLRPMSYSVCCQFSPGGEGFAWKQGASLPPAWRRGGAFRAALQARGLCEFAWKVCVGGLAN